MLQFFFQCGIFGWPLLALTIFNAVMVVRLGIGLWRGVGVADATVEHRINAVLFWGAIGLLIGFLGQHSGLYHALRVIASAERISPRLVAVGVAESLTTTLFGMTLFLGSALAWFALRGRYGRLLSRVERVRRAA